MRVRCSCGKDLKVPDHLAGKKLRCPACGKGLLTQAEEADPVEEVEQEKKAAPRPAARKQMRPAPEEDAVDEERPAPRKAGSKRKKRVEKTGLSPVLILVLALVGVGVLGGGGLAVYLLTRPAKSQTPVVDGPGKGGTPAGQPPTGQPPIGQPPPGPPPALGQVLTAEEVTAELAVPNWLPVSKKYLGKTLTIVGVIAFINGAEGEPQQIVLKGCNGECHVSCAFSQPPSPQAKQLKKGQRVKVRGTCDEAGQNGLNLVDCEIIDLGAVSPPVLAPGEPVFHVEVRLGLEHYRRLQAVPLGQVVKLKGDFLSADKTEKVVRLHVGEIYTGAEKAVPAADLTRDFATDPEAAQKKYPSTIIVEGKLRDRLSATNSAVLDGHSPAPPAGSRPPHPTSVDPAGLIASSGFNSRRGLNTGGTGGAPFPLDMPNRPGGEGEPGWATNWTASPNTVFQSTVVHEGDGALRIKGVQGCRRVLAKPQTGRFQIEQYLYLPPGGDFVCYLRKNGNDSDVGPMWRAQNGRFRVLNGDKRNGPGVWTDTGFACAPNTWYKVTVRIDVPQNTWEFLVNDKPFAAAPPLGFRTRQLSLDQIDYGSFGAEGFYLDAVRVLGWPGAGKGE